MTRVLPFSLNIGSEARIDPRFTEYARQPGLDLLRALAIIVVVIYHAGIFGFSLPRELHRFGWIGVDLFFVLSGYLIGGQLLAPLTRNEPIRLGRFFARRALRIMPAYLVTLLIYFSLPSLREFPEISPLLKFLVSGQNIGLRGGTAFSHAWSLAIEDQFYLLLPLIILAVNRRPRTGFLVICSVFAAGLILRGLLAYLHPGEGGSVSFRGFQRWIYYPTWTRLDPLVFGVVLAAIQRFRPPWWKRLTDGATWLWLPAFGAIIYGLHIGDNDLTIVTCIWQFPLIAFGMALLLICAVSPRLPFRHMEVPGAAFLASVAYSVYLSHKLVIHAVTQFCSSYHLALTSLPAILLVEICIYVAGALLFFAVERPFLLLRRRVVD